MTQYDGPGVTPMASEPVYEAARRGEPLVPFNPEKCEDVPILVEALAEATHEEPAEVCAHLNMLGLRRFLDEYVLI